VCGFGPGKVGFEGFERFGSGGGGGVGFDRGCLGGCTLDTLYHSNLLVTLLRGPAEL